MPSVGEKQAFDIFIAHFAELLEQREQWWDHGDALAEGIEEYERCPYEEWNAQMQENPKMAAAEAYLEWRERFD